MRLKFRFPLEPLLVLAAAGLLLMIYALPASAVPAFVRQTNMSCNQCHTAHGGPVPNFTMTGKKFRSTGYRIVEVRETMQSGKKGDLGERLNLPLLDYLSFRLQSNLVATSTNPFDGEWSEFSSNPTTRFSFFFVGKVGDHIGIWNEWYFHTLGSANDEWSLDLGSWDEWDIRYTFNPDNPDYTIGVGVTNQSFYDILGFGPFPVFAGGGNIARGSVGGYAHPNFGTLFFYGWMLDRWIWSIGGNTGDTNVGWDKSNLVWQVGYALLNTNANELWLHLLGRSGTDVMPLVTTNYVKTAERDWSYRDAVTGISDTRPEEVGPYVSGDIDKAHTVEGEVRWGRQDWGPHSFESVVRFGYSTEDYRDGASTQLSTFGIDVLYGWRHTFYAMPFFNIHTAYDFTDMDGMEYSIDSKPQYGINFGFKPIENMLVNLQYLTFQVLHLDEDSSDKGKSVSCYIDLLI